MIDYELLEELYNDEPKIVKNKKIDDEYDFYEFSRNKTNRNARRERRKMKEYHDETEN